MNGFLGGLGTGLGQAIGNIFTHPATTTPAPAPGPVVVAPPPPPVYRPVFIPPPPPPSPVVMAEQARLHELGFLYGPVDGVYGEMTRQAIIRWQASQGRALTGVLTSDEVAVLLPSTSTDIKPQAPSSSPSDTTKPSAPTMTASTAAIVPTQSSPPPAPPVQVAAAAVPAPAPSATDAISTVKVGMPYWQARTILTGAGWQTGFVDASKLAQAELVYRAWFTDHHISEAEDCSATGCAMQFHNMDGRLLYVFTTSGAKDSDAYRGAGPSVIAVCLDAKDITCPSSQKLTN